MHAEEDLHSPVEWLPGIEVEYLLLERRQGGDRREALIGPLPADILERRLCPGRRASDGLSE